MQCFPEFLRIFASFPFKFSFVIDRMKTEAYILVEHSLGTKFSDKFILKCLLSLEFVLPWIIPNWGEGSRLYIWTTVLLNQAKECFILFYWCMVLSVTLPSMQCFINNLFSCWNQFWFFIMYFVLFHCCHGSSVYGQFMKTYSQSHVPIYMYIVLLLVI